MHSFVGILELMGVLTHFILWLKKINLALSLQTATM